MTPQGLCGPARVAQRHGPCQALAALAPAMPPPAHHPPACPLGQARPGAAPVCAPRRRGALGAPRARPPSAAALQKSAGSAPGPARSGQPAWGQGRRQGPPCLRHTFVEGAAAALRHAFWAQGYDQPQRAQVQRPQAAVRALALPGLRLLSRCWQERSPDAASLSPGASPPGPIPAPPLAQSG